MKVARILVGMRMATVMMSTTMKPASLMEEIAVVELLIHIIAHNAYALKEEVEEAVERQNLQELQLMAKGVIRVGLLMGIAMISTII